MAKYAELPDGTRLEFPDETPDDVIDATVKRELGVSQEVAPRNLGISDMGMGHPAAKLSEGLSLGLGNAVSGFKQLTEAVGSRVRPESAPLFEDQTDIIKARDARAEELGAVGKTGAFVGEVAPSMAVPGGVQGSLGRRIFGGAALDAASSIADPVREDQTRSGNVALAAGTGGALRAVGGGATAFANRLRNASAGNLKSKEFEDLIKSADAEGIRIFFDDVSQGALAKKASVASEIFGVFGTAPGRKAQGEEALAAAERWLKRFAGDSDEYAEVVQSGLRNKLRIFQKAASKKYAAVADKIGPDAVVTPKFDEAIDKAIEMETAKGGRANKAVIDLLQRYKDSPKGDFDRMIEFRSDFNGDVRNLYKGDNTPNKTAGDAIRLAKDALNDDMGDFARGKGAFEAWRKADGFYRDTVVQFKEGKLKALTNEKSAANFDEQAAWKYLVQQTTNPERARRMWQSLDSRGRAAVRQGFISEAYEAAVSEGRPFSPARFAGYIEKRMPVAEQFFRGQSQKELKGLVKVMRHVERAGQFAENPPTGQRVILPLLAGGAAISPETVAAGTGAALTIKGMFQTQTGRNLLLAANTATEGSKAMDNIVDQLAKTVARSSNQDGG